jgi:murein DD-endopeptidase MepM/ murein hydrolase activator NlpD
MVSGATTAGSRFLAGASRGAALLLLLHTSVTALAQAEEVGGALPVVSARYDNAATNRTALQQLKIKLPFQSGKTFEVYQGNNGSFTHSKFNQYAWDFGLPEGTPVCAAAEGRVVRVKQDSSTGGTTPDQFAFANTVVIDHGNGLFSQYLHLKRASVLVNEGQLVEGGQVIALSGNTGFSSVPHLHFQVQDATGQSVPARFEDVAGDGVPVQGQTYTSANDGTGTTKYIAESLLPANAFERNSIELTSCQLPAHLLRCDNNYKITGKVFTPARKVAVFLMSSRGGKALLSVFAPVNPDGTFTAELKLNDLKQTVPNWSALPTQSNTFSLALAPVKSDGSFWTNFSIPVCLR